MKKIIYGIAVICCMLIIFSLSHQPATLSDELSTGVTEYILAALKRIAPDAAIDLNNSNHIVRKNAHFFIYLVLGVLVVSTLRRFGIGWYRVAGWALLICVVFAITDEVHQIFVPGRGAQVQDVLIDSAGACLGIGLYALFSRIFRRKAKQNG